MTKCFSITALVYTYVCMCECMYVYMDICAYVYDFIINFIINFIIDLIFNYIIEFIINLIVDGELQDNHLVNLQVSTIWLQTASCPY